MKNKGFFFILLLAASLIAPVAAVRSQTTSTNTPPVRSALMATNVQAPPTGQIIIKFVDEVSQQTLSQQDLDGIMTGLSQAAGVPLAYGRPMSGEAHVLQLPASLPLAEVAEITARLSREPGVLYAEPDAIRQIDVSPAEVLDVLPNDTRYDEQWHYGYSAGTAEGINLPPAWQITSGISSTVVAVIDTGILNHSDLAGRTVPGYDFISIAAVANDGDGRDSDPSDPGDWVPIGSPLCSPARNSSWHGTHVAGTIGAASNNSQGVAGVNWFAKILPVRVLGRCGGLTSDIVDGSRWAAGLSVPGVPANANPADVINLSLGGPGSCSTTEQDAFTEIKAAGTTVIIAAGNSGLDASGFSPGNCNDVVTVAANDRGGDRASYSNFGSVVEVTAPGGETATLANGVLSTLDGGTTTPANDNAYAFYQGTSMATPHVAGVASLIIGQQPSYTPDQVLSTLQTTARAFPSGSTCNTGICGSGIVDAFAALNSLRSFDHSLYLPAILKSEPGSPPNPFTNPDFEQGPTGWIESSTNGFNLILQPAAEPGLDPILPLPSGQWAVWLGGFEDEISSIEQTVTVPVGAPYLTYRHWIASNDSCGWDFAKILVGGTEAHVYDLCAAENTSGWEKYGVNLSAYGGQSVTLRIRAETDDLPDSVSSLFIDDVSFESQAP